MNEGKPFSGTQDRMTRSARFVTISVSEPYEGVGRALASAYSAIEQADLPLDMMRLLDQIDREGDDRKGNPAGG